MPKGIQFRFAAKRSCFGVRRQSEAATALWAEARCSGCDETPRFRVRLAINALSQSGVPPSPSYGATGALRLPPQSKRPLLARRRFDGCCEHRLRDSRHRRNSLRGELSLLQDLLLMLLALLVRLLCLLRVGVLSSSSFGEVRTGGHAQSQEESEVNRFH